MKKEEPFAPASQGHSGTPLPSAAALHYESKQSFPSSLFAGKEKDTGYPLDWLEVPRIAEGFGSASRSGAVEGRNRQTFEQKSNWRQDEEKEGGGGGKGRRRRRKRKEEEEGRQKRKRAAPCWQLDNVFKRFCAE